MLDNVTWPDWARYRAYDQDGTITYFEVKPILKRDGGIWDTALKENSRFYGEWERGKKYDLAKLKIDWAKSLQTRPKPWPEKGIYKK